MIQLHHKKDICVIIRLLFKDHVDCMCIALYNLMTCCYWFDCRFLTNKYKAIIIDKNYFEIANSRWEM